MNRTAMEILNSCDHPYSTKLPDGNGSFRVVAPCRDCAECALFAQINTPEVVDFMEGVKREAVHQRERWGSGHDVGKTPADWFWLVGHLLGKAIHKPEKRLHHIITACAALLNWHLQSLGQSDMRPGIEDPDRKL